MTNAMTMANVIFTWDTCLELMARMLPAFLTTVDTSLPISSRILFFRVVNMVRMRPLQYQHAKRQRWHARTTTTIHHHLSTLATYNLNVMHADPDSRPSILTPTKITVWWNAERATASSSVTRSLFVVFSDPRSPSFAFPDRESTRTTASGRITRKRSWRLWRLPWWSVT